MTIRPVKVITASDLEENGGVYLVQKGIPAVPVWGFTEQGNQAVGSKAQPVYVVSEAEFNAGDFVKGRGQPMRVIENTGKVVEGRTAVPVWAVNDWPDSGVTPLPPYVTNVLATNPDFYLPSDELTGVIFDNAEGTAALDTAITGITLNNTDGPNTGERAGLWDGVNDYAVIPAAALQAIWNGEDFTIGLWAKLTSFVSSQRLLEIATTTGDLVRLITRTSPVGFLFTVTAGGGGDGVQTDGGDANWVDPVANWIHLTITRTDSDNTLRFYLNNGTPKTNSGSTGIWGGTINSAIYGAANATPDNPLGGHMMHLVYYSRVITAGERAILATAV